MLLPSPRQSAECAAEFQHQPYLFDPLQQNSSSSTPLNPGSSDIRNAKFADNYGGTAGDIYSYNSNGDMFFITNSSFRNSSTAGSGGAISALIIPTTVITQCNFSGQHADVNGGAISVVSGDLLEVVDSTIQGCVAGAAGGAISATRSSVQVRNSVIAGNTAGLGRRMCCWYCFPCNQSAKQQLHQQH